MEPYQIPTYGTMPTDNAANVEHMHEDSRRIRWSDAVAVEMHAARHDVTSCWHYHAESVKSRHFMMMLYEVVLTKFHNLLLMCI